MVMMGVVVVEYDNEKVADDDDGVMMVMTIEKNAMVIIKMELVMAIIIDHYDLHGDEQGGDAPPRSDSKRGLEEGGRQDA